MTQTRTSPLNDASSAHFANVSTGVTADAGVCLPTQVRCYVGDDEERWSMWYSGRGAEQPALPGLDAITPSSGSLGVAISNDGMNWARGVEGVSGARGDDAPADVGRVLEPNKDWWTFDTAHLSVSDVQVRVCDR